MISFDNNFIISLKDKIDIVDVISSYIPTQKKGRDYWACCPFHVEKTPSFQISSEKQIFYCYGCHKGGDVIKFTQDFNKLDFVDAVSELAKKYHIEIPQNVFDKEYTKKKEEREKILEINKEAAKFYFNNLSKKEGYTARKYLYDRKLSDKTISNFGIGVSLDYTSLGKHLLSKGYSEESIIKSKICYKNEKGELIDFFAERICIPIISYNGDFIGFSARLLEKKPSFAKYKNSPDSIVFSKKNVLFGLNMIKKYMPRNERSLILVEGHMDLISLFQNEIVNVVASMGTALTEEQCTLIKRACDLVYVSYDGDSAGQNATLRGLDLLAKTGLEVKVVQLKNNMDPDDYVKEHGKEGYLKLVSEAVPLVQFKLNKVLEEFNPNKSTEMRIKYLKGIKPIIDSLDDIEKNVYLNDLMNQFSLTKNEIDGILNNNSTDIKEKKVDDKKDNKIDLKILLRIEASRKVIFGIIRNEDYINYNLIIPDVFVGKHKEIYENIIKRRINGGKFIDSDLYNFYTNDEEEPDRIIDVYNNKEESRTPFDFYSCLLILLKDKLEEIVKLLNDLSKSTENKESEQKKLIVEHTILRKLIGEVDKTKKEFSSLR
ncbi:MAG: DNA primase [Clostridia bacterium]|nr:DNA primase [Clostridia bacterium]